jgi:DNA-directed RNA polymerase subunit RPC12/RpoP
MYITIFLIIVGLVFFGLMFLGGYLCWRYEKNMYNNGVCTKCGNELRLVDEDSQGGRCYHCDNCGRYIWISYNVDKHRKDGEE